jgi:signal transduction histidine kinase
MKNYALSILDNLPTAIAVVNETGAITYGNHEFTSTFGPGAEEWFKAATRTVGGERGWLQGFFLAQEGEQHEIDVDFNSRTYHVQRVPSPPTPLGVALEFEDVTRQREAEQAKSDFTSMIVHDLRGPLSGIQGSIDFILGGDTARFDPLHEELLREANRESERMMGLINELLDFSKIESGNFEVEKEAVQLAAVLKRSVLSLQSVASRDSVYLMSAHGLELPTINGSVEKLTQAIINLISNSVKFTPKKGVISVGAQVIRDEQGPKAVVLTVTDSGTGIKGEDRNKIFEKYKQSKSKSFRGGGGTGLGLYIVKQIVEAHGGEVNVASIEGQGTCMIVKIPVRRATPAAA